VVIAGGSTIPVNASGFITIPGAQLPTAELRLPNTVTGHVEYQVFATATESSNGSTLSSSIKVLALDIAPVTTGGGLVASQLIDPITTAADTAGTSANNTFTGTAAVDLYTGKQGADTINLNGGDDWATGDGGNDTINGGDGNDVLDGNAGNDSITGGNGADQLYGSEGNDTLVMTETISSKDTAYWNLDARGTPGSPALDTIVGYNTATANGASAGDVINLRDLLVGEWFNATSTGNLNQYIDITLGANTILNISSTGGYTNGTLNTAVTDQRITLTGVNLSTAAGSTVEDTVLNWMLTNGKLVVM
jgi:hypothetical protein